MNYLKLSTYLRAFCQVAGHLTKEEQFIKNKRPYPDDDKEIIHGATIVSGDGIVQQEVVDYGNYESEAKGGQHQARALILAFGNLYFKIAIQFVSNESHDPKFNKTVKAACIKYNLSIDFPGLQI